MLIAVAARKIVGIEDLITSKIAIEDIIEKGFQALLNDKESQGKPVGNPSAPYAFTTSISS